MRKKLEIEVTGCGLCTDLFHAISLAKDLYRSQPYNFHEPVVKIYGDIEWSLYKRKLGYEFNREIYKLKHPMAVLINKRFVGDYTDFLSYLESKNIFIRFKELPNINNLTIEEMLIMKPERKYVKLDLTIDKSFIGRLYIELFCNRAPTTCATFWRYCKSYKVKFGDCVKNSTVHDKPLEPLTRVSRVMEDCWLEIIDYSYSWKGAKRESNDLLHDRMGILSMGPYDEYKNCPFIHFFITLESTPVLDGLYTAFGRVIYGEQVLLKVNSLRSYYGYPVNCVKIGYAGIVSNPYEVVKEPQAVVDSVILGGLSEVLEERILSPRSEADIDFRRLQLTHKKKVEESGASFEILPHAMRQKRVEQKPPTHISPELYKKPVKSVLNAVEYLVNNILIEISKTESKFKLPADNEDLNDETSSQMLLDRYKAGLYSLPEELRKNLYKKIRNMPKEERAIFSILSESTIEEIIREACVETKTSDATILSGMVMTILKTVVTDITTCTGNVLKVGFETRRWSEVSLMSATGPAAPFEVYEKLCRKPSQSRLSVLVPQLIPENSDDDNAAESLFLSEEGCEEEQEEYQELYSDEQI